MKYRKPSLKSALGITKAKRKIKKDLGIYKVTKVTNLKKNTTRKVKKKLGNETTSMSFFRFLKRLMK